ncbi:anaerobic ribonucleoside-triphosphate reductase activating protein [Eggerthellaceae bacterium 3-80]|nr:anaerobic ribonucleoside-triphosphate reductase activating protein [bacterium D16-34]
MTDYNVQLFGVAPDSIVDGPGLRFAIFVQGCSHACPGCHNADSQPKTGGTSTTVDALMAQVEANKLISGVTLSGGEPFEQAHACAEIARRAHALGLNVWAYSGYLFEDLQADCTPGAKELLDEIDILVDGPFVQARHSFDLEWRGSSNQRIIDVKASTAQGSVVLWQHHEEFPTKPDSW